MEPAYRGDQINIWGIENPSRRACTYEINESRNCKLSPTKLFVVERYNLVLAGVVCYKHKDIIAREAEKDTEAILQGMEKKEHIHLNNLLGTPQLHDFFDPPKVSLVRGLERVDFEGASLDDLVKSACQLKRWQHLVVPKEFEIVPSGIENFRKKGLFLDIPKQQREDFRTAARIAILSMDPTVVYAGMRHMDLSDNARREYALVTIMEGSMIHNLLSDRARRRGLHFDEKIVCEDKYPGSGIFGLYIPSSSNKDYPPYRVDLREIRTRNRGTRRYRERYGVKYDCTCEASFRDELTLSDMNSGGRHYANSKIRPCKHAYAALAYLEDANIIPSDEPRVPVKPTPFARRFNSSLRFRVLHGNNHLKREEQEVILMRAIAPHLLGYDRMFE